MCRNDTGILWKVVKLHNKKQNRSLHLLKHKLITVDSMYCIFNLPLIILQYEHSNAVQDWVWGGVICEMSSLNPLMEVGSDHKTHYRRPHFPLPGYHQCEVFIIRLITVDTPYFYRVVSDKSSECRFWIKMWALKTCMPQMRVQRVTNDIWIVM